MLIPSFLTFAPLREPETQQENIKEELPNVNPAAEDIAEPLCDQTKQEETIDMVGCQVLCTGFTGFAVFQSVILCYNRGQKLDLENIKTTSQRVF